MSDPRYPIGEFTYPGPLDPERRAAVAGLVPVQLDTPHRPEGWTVRQVVHHPPDSHLNGYTRSHLALTEPSPTIKPYDEVGRARGYHHPGQGRDFTLDEALAVYAWHGEHHTAHITALRRRKGWTEPTAAAPA